MFICPGNHKKCLWIWVSIHPMLMFIGVVCCWFLPTNLVSIHPMLMFIKWYAADLPQRNSFNTSYVNVYLLSLLIFVHSLLVSIHPMLMFILPGAQTVSALHCFNTSYVNVYQRTRASKTGSTVVSIHPMLMFILFFTRISLHPTVFQYILC